MTLRERIQKLCKIYNSSLNQVETELGFGKGYLSKLDNSTPNTKKMEQVANHFGVTIDFLMGYTDNIVCPECEIYYNPLDETSISTHREMHEMYEKVLTKYGFCYSLEESGKLEVEAINVLSSSGSGYLSTNDLKMNYIQYLKADFSFLLRKYHFNNIPFESFEEYARSKIQGDLHEGFMTHDLLISLADEFNIDLEYIDGSDQLLARVSKNDQLLRILGHLEKLSPEMLNALEIQTKALAEQCTKE